MLFYGASTASVMSCECKYYVNDYSGFFEVKKEQNDYGK